MPTPAMLDKYGITIDDWRAYSSIGTDASDEAIYAGRIDLNHNVLENYLAGRTFDWYDHSFREGFNQDYNISISGASDKRSEEHTSELQSLMRISYAAFC